MLLVTGGSGMLGGYVTDVLSQNNIAYIAPKHHELELNCLEKLNSYLNNNQLSGIIHLAAETNVDLCEQDPAHALLVNTLSTQALANYARVNDIPITFISTSAIFGGIPKLSYCELDTPMPLSFYGSSKYMAEQYIASHCPRHLIIRSSFMIGGGPDRDKKFISKILPKLQNHEPVSVVYDKIGSLTYAADVAKFIVNAYKNQQYGLVHLSSNNSCSRYDVIKHMAKQLNSNSDIKKVTSQLFPLAAPRPMSEALHSVSPYVKANQSWENIINEYLKEWTK